MFCTSDVIEESDLHITDIPVRSNQTDPTIYNQFDGEKIIEYKVAKEQVLDAFTIKYLLQLLKKTGGNVSQSAEISGLTRTALQKIMRRKNINAADYRENNE